MLWPCCAGTPVAVFLVGLCFGTEHFSWQLLLDILLITAGVGISAFGEVNLVMLGLVLLLISMCADAVRLTFVQQLVQSSEIRFNPITTLYYIAPLAAMCLTVPCIFMELRGAMAVLSAGTTAWWHFLLNGFAAFSLNLAVYLLIGRTSALTMNVSGLVKDWFTISFSVIVFKSTVTFTNLLGYGIAFVGVCWYNYIRMWSTPAPKPQVIASSGKQEQQSQAEDEEAALLGQHDAKQQQDQQ